MSWALAIFWACLAGTAYVYFGYPLLLLLLARLRPRPVSATGAKPSVTILVPAYNEEGVIGEKVGNCLALDYPPELLEVLVVSDGSTDRTEAIVRELAAAHPDRVRLVVIPRSGKVGALNEGALRARGEVLVLTDANSILSGDALGHLVSAFADPEVGGVCGNKKLSSPDAADATAGGEGLYWRYDKWLKALESRIGSIFAADGGLYALRRELYTPLEDPAQADDIALSARVVLAGYRLLYEGRAVAVEDAPEEGRAELRRKVRVTNHSVRALLNLGSGLWLSGFYSVELLSHKLVRHLIPWLLLPMLAAHVVLAFRSPFFAGALVLHLGFYALALVGFLLRRRRIGRARFLYVPYYFTLVNLAAFLGVLSILRGERFAQWTPRQGGET